MTQPQATELLSDAMTNFDIHELADEFTQFSMETDRYSMTVEQLEGFARAIESHLSSKREHPPRVTVDEIAFLTGIVDSAEKLEAKLSALRERLATPQPFTKQDMELPPLPEPVARQAIEQAQVPVARGFIRVVSAFAGYQPGDMIHNGMLMDKDTGRLLAEFVTIVAHGETNE